MPPRLIWSGYSGQVLWMSARVSQVKGPRQYRRGDAVDLTRLSTAVLLTELILDLIASRSDYSSEFSGPVGFVLMCVAALAWDAHPDYLLVAIGNRDEFHDRPAAPLSRWDDGSGIIAGRDLRAGGTWLGVTEAGRFALLTNFRDPDGIRSDRPSRGSVVTDLLSQSEPRKADQMNPFNAVSATRSAARFMTNYPAVECAAMTKGVMGISNGSIGRPWPKTLQLCDALHGWLASESDVIPELFEALRQETPSPVNPAPADGPHPDYAPVFIRNPVYGTRCSTVLAVRRDGQAAISERSFNAQGKDAGRVHIDFQWGKV